LEPREAAGMTRHIALLTAVAAVFLAVPAAAAQADTIALTVAPDRLEEVPFMVTATGSGAEDHNVFATIKPAGPTGCGATYGTDADGDDVMFSVDAEGTYTATGTAEVEGPGTYLLCAWIQEFSGDSVALAATSMMVDVRSARSSLVIHGKKTIRRSRTRQFDFSGATELDRYVFAKVKRTGSRRCGSSYETDNGDSVLWSDAVQGYYHVRKAPSSWDVDRRGHYLICAWVQESSSDLFPEAAASFRFRVR
jgi:hypothetical protein